MAMTESTNSQTNGKSDSLIFAHVIFRHGERNILDTYPNDPYKYESYWPTGFGQLTKAKLMIYGKKQLFELGQYFRRRYDKLLGKKYSPNKIYVQSTDFDRTIMSAQAALAGLYPPEDDEKFCDHISWQPIPVHTTPWHLDYVLANGKSSEKFEAVQEKYMEESAEIQEIYTKHADLFTYLTEMSGEDIEDISDIYYLYNTLTIEKSRNLMLPYWAEKVIAKGGAMEHIAKLNFKLGSATPELARIRSGFLIKEIMERFTKKIFSTLEPDRSLWLYSAHDDTISNVLNSLGVFKLHFPPTACSLHFELHKPNENEHYIQIFYRKSKEEFPKAIKLPGCGDRFTVDQFYHRYKLIIPEDFESECGSP